ncbi:enoyl-[acyl-carrier-protein] reductase [NADH] 1, chloroplastic-like [Zingiber officinale]|uniref:enoyl-[acyl-carrier-protein] reductase [NADH] 1, chloroplastic-like n=1 Tax=Zingiber officinale TaxID=94328 RepID=UPI001C4ABA75|nr:enoyl-[acyl-carrier-protein] reductase [NADH] 1, chloroplastic-like [Zingiber officinale]
MTEAVTKDFGRIDILVHSLANGPEVTKPLLETSRRGYLATISASSYSFVSLLRHFLPIMNPGKRCFNIFDIHSFRKGNPRIRRWNELSKSCIGERYKSAGF